MLHHVACIYPVWNCALHTIVITGDCVPNSNYRWIQLQYVVTKNLIDILRRARVKISFETSTLNFIISIGLNRQMHSWVKTKSQNNKLLILLLLPLHFQVTKCIVYVQPIQKIKEYSSLQSQQFGTVLLA